MIYLHLWDINPAVFSPGCISESSGKLFKNHQYCDFTTDLLQQSWLTSKPTTWVVQGLTFCKVFVLSIFILISTYTPVPIFCWIIWKWISILWYFLIYFNFSVCLLRTISMLWKLILLIFNVFIPQFVFCSLFFFQTRIQSRLAHCIGTFTFYNLFL